MQVQVFGHDQHVLNIHEVDLDAAPLMEETRAVNLEAESSIGYRGEAQRRWGQWGLGLDLFWVISSSKATVPATAAGGAVDRVSFEIADQTFTSTGPGEVLFYDVLEDNQIAAWTVDLYGIRTLAEKPDSAIHLQFGLRAADFDNDYRAAVGIQDVAGVRLDASSNYGMMLGPIVGLAGDARWGRNAIKGYLGQSVVIGTAELSSRSREFDGPFSDMPSFLDEEVFRAEQDVGIPITELRLKWTYRLTDRLSLGVGAHASAWWDVPVPPGVIPIEDGAESLHENTIVFFGLLGAVELSF